MIATQPHATAWQEDEWVLISALEHASYCSRQCALIHVEQTYDENLFTLRGNRAHRQAHEPGAGTTRGVRTLRGLPLWSDRLGLQGRADVVEFPDEGAPVPVEYKSGKKRTWQHEARQLCAQALCLEEMLDTVIDRGAVYYHASRERREVVFDAALRADVERLVAEVRAMLREQRLPPAVHDRRCRDCSLREACLPHLIAAPHILIGLRPTIFQPDDGHPSDDWE